MRQIKTKNIQIPLKSDSSKPFFKLILFNDKMGYLNRWLANCKINQKHGQKLKSSYQKNWFLCIPASINSVPYHPTQIPHVHDPQQISELQLSLSASRGSICPPLRKNWHQKALLFNKQEIFNAIPRMFTFNYFCSIKVFTALISILSRKQLHI